MEQYLSWLKSELHIDVTDSERTRYNSVLLTARADVEASLAWTSLHQVLRDEAARYTVDTNGYPLFSADTDSEPVLLMKTFDSMLAKTFRLNVLENINFPSPPDPDWIRPDNWLTRINDNLRTRILVRYLDGVVRLSTVLESHFDSYGHSPKAVLLARDYGYYCCHIGIAPTVSVPGASWCLEQLKMPIEIQVTTQVQEIIGRLTHQFYERRRLADPGGTVNWQWNYKSDEFVPNYLGHLLHYVEGMIMEVRDRSVTL
jgi:hypothetical protein